MNVNILPSFLEFDILLIYDMIKIALRGVMVDSGYHKFHLYEFCKINCCHDLL